MSREHGHNPHQGMPGTVWFAQEGFQVPEAGGLAVGDLLVPGRSQQAGVLVLVPRASGLAARLSV